MYLTLYLNTFFNLYLIMYLNTFEVYLNTCINKITYISAILLTYCIIELILCLIFRSFSKLMMKRMNKDDILKIILKSI